MNLDPKILCRINRKAVSITLWDKTVVGVTNPYGWQPEAGGENTQNPKKSEVTAIKLVLTYKDQAAITYDLNASQRASYLNNTEGVTLLSTDILGDDYDNFPDGRVEIQMQLFGSNIGGAPSAWTAYGYLDQFFIVFLENMIRNWVIAMPVPVHNLVDVFDVASANIILDALQYNVAFGKVDEAQNAFDFLTELVNSGKMISEYVEEQNI